jgi:ArsR family transcriptional regulator, arsenate/arsenite/antimonite-responsive transcriptional repressor / arsenate reductase (thioredoxin)
MSRHGTPSVIDRAARHAALGDPARLAIVEALLSSDRTPSELGVLVEASSNLLAHHLDVLEGAGLIERTKSSGDGRRRYVRVRHENFPRAVRATTKPGAALFVCTKNSARSQLAAALWTEVTGAEGTSAGTHPASRIHPQAISAARRAGLRLPDADPRHLDQVHPKPALVITVCDQVHEELQAPSSWLHWSISDPVAVGRASAFDQCIRELQQRITAYTGADAA